MKKNTLLDKTLCNNFPQDEGVLFTASITRAGIALTATSTGREYLYENEEMLIASDSWFESHTYGCSAKLNFKDDNN